MKQPVFFKTEYAVYPAYTSCKLRILPIAPLQVDPGAKYELKAFAFSGIRMYGLRNSACPPTQADGDFFSRGTAHLLTLKDNGLEMDIRFPQEDCYRLELYINDEKIEILEVYALEEDLFHLTPFKGDCHVHTCMSDGQESPQYMTAALCKSGLDFCAITDHMLYQPSVDAKAFCEDLGADFLVINGEEVHSRNNRVHIVHLGGTESVNTWWQENEEAYFAAAEQELAKIPEPMAKDQKFDVAASQVIFDRIHAVEGLAVLCHPHWSPVVSLNQAQDVTEYLCEHRRFDILELVAGGATQGQQLQYNYFNGWTAPIMGNSDIHGCFLASLEPKNYTLVFAKDLSWPAIKEAFLKGLCLGGDDEQRLHGDYRLARYGEFLERNFYPKQKQARKTLGVWMMRWASGRAFDDPNDVLTRPTVMQLFDELRYKA